MDVGVPMFGKRWYTSFYFTKMKGRVWKTQALATLKGLNSTSFSPTYPGPSAETSNKLQFPAIKSLKSNTVSQNQKAMTSNDYPNDI